MATRAVKTAQTCQNSSDVAGIPATETESKALRVAVPNHATRSERRPGAPKATRALAFDTARHRIRTGHKLDMVALAADLGVTLYRWTGDRDRLLADVWSPS